MQPRYPQFSDIPNFWGVNVKKMHIPELMIGVYLQLLAYLFSILQWSFIVVSINIYTTSIRLIPRYREVFALSLISSLQFWVCSDGLRDTMNFEIWIFYPAVLMGFLRSSYSLPIDVLGVKFLTPSCFGKRRCSVRYWFFGTCWDPLCGLESGHGHICKWNMFTISECWIPSVWEH